MSTEEASNNNRLEGESKIKYEKLKKQLETPIDTDCLEGVESQHT